MCQATTAVEDDHDGSGKLESVFLSLIKQENNCSCNVSAKNVQNFVNVNITRLNNLKEQSLCGMEIDIYFVKTDEIKQQKSIPTKCNSTENTIQFSLFVNEYLRFTSRIVNANFSIRYCIQIERGL